MTPFTDDLDALRRIIADTNALLIDFDGPVCSVFAGIPAATVANQLRAVLAQGGHEHLPDDVQTTTDPFDVLFYAAKLGHDEARYIEAAFRAHEVEAVQRAAVTPGSTDLLREWHWRGAPLAIVSNNSVAAIETYLDIQGIRSTVDYISARNNADISQLKPNPHLVTLAVENLGLSPTGCTLIGDSLTDVEAGHAAATRTVAYANKPEKIEKFKGLEPNIVVTSIRVILDAIRDQ